MGYRTIDMQGSILGRPVIQAFTAFGIDQETDTFFIYVQPDNDPNASTLDMVRDRFVSLGVDKAVLFDSGGSSMLVVDSDVIYHPENTRLFGDRDKLLINALTFSVEN